MNPWSHLHNARHIDWVIASVKENPDIWVRARTAARGADRDAALGAAWNAAVDAAWNAACSATWSANRSAARDAALGAALGAAWDVIAALIAYDDCDGYLCMTYEQLHAWALLSEQPQAVLLLPMKWIQEQQSESKFDHNQQQCYTV